ncbi:PACE efflux transporter [Citreicella sp. C3M06]|uniref:PACE efflux transporter n=1 Tax=Citreicella sp. C3M06 TaxID=2841564 RepID=UPI001C0A1D69|nr:PACE efflux transporter [Citreicella sp. C3M06]MBU2961190.1 PACE efflux transporter [Citreicella sp. C3M06]
MRSTSERLFHAITFEIFGILLVVPLGALAFGLHLTTVGLLSITLASIATLWNYAYNIVFDRALLRWRGDLRKTPALRVLHAVLFEAGLLMVSLPLIALSLGVGLIEALLMEAGLALFYLVYAFVFNWGWDKAFPPVAMGHEA